MLTMQEPHTVVFVPSTGIGKPHLALDLPEEDYFNHFDFIIIICTTLRYNSTYKSRKWFWTDPHIIQIEPSNRLPGVPKMPMFDLMYIENDCIYQTCFYIF